MPPRIGLIISSTRQPRICPQVADFVYQTINSSISRSTSTPKPTLHKIDLLEVNLPFFDEPIIPQQIKDPSLYHHEHTRSWSRLISSHDAFIFISPQYNCGYPAALKNAIDYLFNEWSGKPVMIVTYGGRGGGQCAAQLAEVLKGMGMKGVDGRVELKYPDFEFMKSKAFVGGKLGLDAEAEDGLWSDERAKIVACFEAMVGLLDGKDGEA